MGVFSIEGCDVQIHDEPLYGDMGPDGAVEVHFLSSGQTVIPKAQWDSLRFGMVCMPQSSFSDFKKEIEELCSNTSCSYEVKQAMKVVFNKIEFLRTTQ